MQADNNGFDYKSACPICNGLRKDCRQSKDSGLAFCRAEATPPSGWHFVKTDDHGFSIYAPDGDRPQNVVPLKAEVKRLSSKQLDREFRKLAMGSTLKADHRSEVARRGVDEQNTISTWHQSSLIFSWPSDGNLSGFPENMPGIDENGSPRPFHGMAIGIPSVDGRIIGAQYRPDRIGDGPKYFWVSSSNIGGSSPHLTNGEMPLGVYGQKSKTLDFCEGFLKSLIASDRHGITAIAQSSGNWAGSPKQLRYTIEQLGADTFILNPDGGMLDEDHRSVILAYERLQQFLLGMGHELKVRWWGQVHYSDEDVDEVTAEKFSHAEIIAWHDFLAKLAYKWQGISSIFSAFPQPKKVELLPIPQKCDSDEKLMIMVENFNRCRNAGNSFQIIPLVRDITTEFRISESRLEDLANQLNRGKVEPMAHMGSTFEDCFQEIEERSESGEMLGVPSSLGSLNDFTQGYQRGDLIITAGRPSMGKTAMVLSDLMAMSRIGFPVGMFSLEMSRLQLAYRLISSYTGIDSQRIKKGQLSPNEWVSFQNAIEALKVLPIYVNDASEVTIEEVVSSVDSWAQGLGSSDLPIGMLAIDHIHIMGGIGHDQNTGLARVTKKLKGLAKRHNIPVNALAQLNRGVESRTDKRPLMSDLRASGGIEQDADLIQMLYRDEYYNPETPDRGVAEVIIAKHRNGPVGTVKVLFDKEYGRFSDMEVAYE